MRVLVKNAAWEINQTIFCLNYDKKSILQGEGFVKENFVFFLSTTRKMTFMVKSLDLFVQK